MSQTPPEHAAWPEWDRIQRTAVIVGAAGLLLCAIGAILDLQQFFASYLAAFNFVLGITLGALAIWMLHNLTGGHWGVVIRRLLEAATRTLPVLLLAAVPLVFGLSELYPWTGPEWLHPETIADKHHRHVIETKALYLNEPFFLTRAAVYFAVWIGIVLIQGRRSAELDRGPNPQLERRAQLFSGPALVLYGLTMTFAAID